MGYLIKISILLATYAFSLDAIVSKQTGTLNLNESFGAISCNSLSLPINLNYQSGIKIDQRSSWVGLGFNLDLPCIDRIAIGSADEKSFAIALNEQATVARDNQCVPNGVIDLSKTWNKLFTSSNGNMANNGYQSEYVVEMTCANTDAALGYTTDIDVDKIPQIIKSDYLDRAFDVTLNGEINVCFSVINGTCIGYAGIIGKTDRPTGFYSAGTLKTWLGLNCTNTNKTVTGIKRRTDFNYTDQQDIYFLNAPFASGRIVCTATPQMTFINGKGFPIVDQSSVFSAQLENFRNIKIKPHFSQPTDGNEPDIIDWELTDENGNSYVFNKVITRYNTESSDLTKKTFDCVNSHYLNGQLQYMGSYPFDERATNPNVSYSFRWYLTMIKGANYSEVAGKRSGDWIEVSYTDGADVIQMKNLQRPLLENESRNMWPLTGVSKAKSLTSSDNYITAIYSASNFCFKPVYPYKIQSPFEEIEFAKSKSIDINTMGDQKLDAIIKRRKIDGTYQVVQKTNFIYDDKGLAVGHPYSSAPNDGLLQLLEVNTEDMNGNKILNNKYFYHSNPTFDNSPASLTSGYFKHDFFGYYSPISVTALKNPFINNDGSSTIDATAWSINRIVSGNGSAVEYEYEPNEISAFTTGEKLPHFFGPGVRVKKETVFSGMKDSLTTVYKYGTGFTNFNMALASYLKEPTPVNYLGEIYLLLNYKQLYSNLQNILILSGNGISYNYFDIITKTGRERTSFLDPYDSLKEYSGVRGYVGLNDGKYGTSAKGNFRSGIVKRIDIYNRTTEIPIYSKIFEYNIKTDVASYITPALNVPMDIITCRDLGTGVGGGGVGDPPSFPEEDIRYLQDTAFVGFVRNIRTTEIKDNVLAREEYSYDEITGSVKKVKRINSDLSTIMTEKVYARDQAIYSDLLQKNILTQLSGTKVWASSPNRNNGVAEVISATASTRNLINNLLVDGEYTWKVNMQSGFPVAPFTDFNYSTRRGTNWVPTMKVTKTDNCQRVVEVEPPGLATNSTIFRNDIGLPLATITNGKYDECAVYTCDYQPECEKNGWELGTGTVVTDVVKHFGNKTVHVINDNGLGKNIPGADNTKDYIFSAWVLPKNSTPILLFADLWTMHYVENNCSYENSANGNTKLIKKIKTQSFAFTADQIGKWQFVSLKIEKGTFSEIKDNPENCLRMTIASGSSAGTDFYVDDIRFYPQNALVKSTYYNPYVQKTISDVDANNHSNVSVEYDGFGRDIRAYKKKIDGTEVNLQKKEYFISNNLNNNAIKLLSPVGGEKLYNGLIVKIKWIAGDNISSVDINVSIDNGVTWKKVNSEAINKNGNIQWGNYDWNITSNNSTQCKIKVVQYNGSVESVSPGIFTIENSSILIPTAPTPSSTATNQDCRPPLTWTSSGTDVKYDVYFATVTPPQNKIGENLSATTMNLTNDLIPGNTYYWRVVAYNGIDTMVGPAWNFSTKPGPYAILKEPTNRTYCGLSPSSITFSWDGTADNYEVFYWEAGTTEPTTAQANTSDNKITFTNAFVANTTYNWKIRANRTYSQTSETWTFRAHSNNELPSKATSLTSDWDSKTFFCKLKWSNGALPNNSTVFYRVFFYVTKVASSSINKNTTSDYRNPWQVRYLDKFKDRINQLISLYDIPLNGVKTKGTVWTVVETFNKEPVIPYINGYKHGGDVIYYYVQTVDYCNHSLLSESDLGVVHPTAEF